MGMCVGEDVGLATTERKGRWEILRNSFKPFPCGIVIHPIIDACSQLHHQMQQEGLNIQHIEAVRARVHPLVLELTGKKEPRDGLEGKFSVYHGAAIGLLYGKGTPSQYEDSVVLDKKVIEIREKVVADADEGLRADEAIVVVEMEGERRLASHVEHAVGSLEVPMSDDMLREKFEDQCKTVLGEGVKKASETCWGIESVEDMREIVRVL